MACNLIRRGLLTRQDAAHIVSNHDGIFPSSYLDKTLESILGEYNISMDEFLQVCDDYTNYDIFKQDTNGNLVRRKDGSPELLASFSETH